MENVTAVILARGLSTRMRAEAPGTQLHPEQTKAADAGLKAMMPVGSEEASGGGGRPFLDYVIASLADAGYTEVGVVIGPEHDQVRERYERDEVPRRVQLEWIIQEKALGTADAVLAAEAWVGSQPFIVVNADNLYPVDVLRQLRELDGPGLPVFTRQELTETSNIPPDRIASFAIVRVTAEGVLVGITEKPGPSALEQAGANALVSVNCWRFDRRIFDACQDVPLSPRGELELPMAVSLAIDRGVKFQTFPARGEVLDLSKRTDVAAVSARLAGYEPTL